MKKNLLLITFSLFIAGIIHAQTKPFTPLAAAADGPKITFDNTVHDFGVIPYMGNGSHIYVITNTGKQPLIITNCIKGCGCTAVDWTKDPINPGEKGMVKAVYNTKKIGVFSRGVDVYSNDPANPKINLRLKGTVENDPNAPPASNPPVQSSQSANVVKDYPGKW